MTPINLRSVLLLSLFSHLSTAQLTGILSQSVQEPEWLTAVITNEGSQHISVLKHNTIFDISHPSMPCRITDEVGKPVQMGGSHVFYSGIRDDDLLDLAPGNNFTRHLNLTEYVDLHDTGSKSDSAANFIISLPPVLQGLVTDDGLYKIHPNASGSQTRMGDMSKANLGDIPLQSQALKVTIPKSPQVAPIAARDQLFNGIGIDGSLAGQCTTEQYTNISRSILYTNFLSVAGNNDAAKFTELPFKYFMPETIEAANTVAAAMDKIFATTSKQGAPVAVTCHDTRKLCSGNALFGYAIFVPGGHPGFIPRVVMCADGIMLPDNIWPCSALPGDMSRAYVLMHELMHIDEISGIQATDWPRPNNYQSARLVNQDVLAGKDTTTDAVALAELASWSWDIGLGGNPWYGTPCTQNFLLGNLDSLVVVDGKTFSG